MAEEHVLVRSLLRNDLTSFTQRCFQTVVPGKEYLRNWHIEAIAHELERCRRREIRRLIITIPPRNLKSITASVAFPAFALGHDPTLRIICASYAQDLATKHARDFRTILERGWYKDLFPQTRIDPHKNTEGEIQTTAQGYRLSTSVGGTLTGRGGNFILIDDPMKPTDAMSDARRAAVAEWYDSTLASRLDNKSEDVIVIIMQRLHIDDLVGHVLDKGGNWTHLNLPAIAEEDEEIQLGGGRVHYRKVGQLLHPERDPMGVLEEQKAFMGSMVFSAQYQQAPVPAGGALIKADWFGTYARPPVRANGDRVIQSWDTATKTGKDHDYSVCTTWLMRGRDYYLLDVLRKRLEYPDLRRRIVSHAAEYDATAVLIEDAGTGAPLVQDLRRGNKLRPIPIRPDRDKLVRMVAQSAVIEAGHVLLPDKAPWLNEFYLEMLAFPGGRHDDQVDSVSQFLAWAARHQSTSSPRVILVSKRSIQTYGG
ncbi:MAG: phage terminase large subunit [Gemmatimonadota bacterium]